MVTLPSTARREQASVLRFANPQTRTGYSLPLGQTHLILLFSGTAGLRNGDSFSGPRLVWHADGGGELLVESGARGILLSIPHVSLMQSLPPTQLGEQMRRTLGKNLSFPLDLSLRIAELVEGFALEHTSREPGSNLAETHYLGLVLVQIWRIARTDIVAHGRAPQGLTERFLMLAAQKARDHWTVETYAEALSVSRDRLGSAVKRSTGLSPQAYLHRALTREAMELLTNTGVPIAQVAFRLGFVDPAYFTRFFKRQVGQNPAAFRKAHRIQNDSAPRSFAAWP